MIVGERAEHNSVGEDDGTCVMVEGGTLGPEEGGETSRVADDDSRKHRGGDALAPERVDLAEGSSNEMIDASVLTNGV